MKKAAIPFGLCALLMFFVPINGVSGLNAVWIAAFMWGYYFFFTLYMIPHNALIPELIQDGPLRVNAYTIILFLCDGQQYASVHGENENISIDKIHLAVDFYKELIRNYP